MAKRRLVGQLFPLYLLIVLAALAAVTWYASRSFKDFYLDEVATDLEARAHLAERQIARLSAPLDRAAVQALCRELGESSGTRLTVVLPDGTVAGDSDEDPGAMDNHADRPEIGEALRGRRGLSTRFSYTLEQNMMYLAVPLRSSGGIIAAVRASIPVSAVDLALRSITIKVALGSLAVALVTAAASLILARRIARPLKQMRRGAERFAAGNLSHRLEVPDSLELGALAVAMNRMAEDLDDKIRTVVKQRNEQEAVLTSMVEGVLAVDGEERILEINSAAAGMIGVDAAGAMGRTIQEIVRNTDLQRFVSRALDSDETVESIIGVGGARDRFIQAHGTVLRGESGARIGAVIVLNDITRLRRLENVRREFVANVSHELKTPITSIKGFVETLRDGAMKNPSEAERFLEIIGRHTDRLNAIIEDLLSLSRIEQESERGEIPLEEGSVRDVLEAAARLCEAQRAARGVAIELECGEETTARMNAPLLEQALLNLMDNAVKYSEPGSTVRVVVEESGEAVGIKVIDSGCGIAGEHLPRLFERFYRVDKARSRELGGTGLGLAIAKHIVQAHGGGISVSSRPGEGSVFFISLPAG